MRFFLLYICLSFCSITSAIAEVYKWVDENGQVHYGDKPTATDKSETINIKSESTTGPDPRLEEQREKQRKLLEIFEEERLEKEQKRAENLQKDKQSKQKCAELKDYYKSIKETSILYDLDAEGNRKYLDENSRARQLEDVEKIINKNCN